ncbi:DEAD/DEAH box helicase family protein [Candidatus Nomurabacteria bacterium]|nr:DEAD/DEAH box helicase family protein [Candidatus Nomurabacteria bacterium]
MFESFRKKTGEELEVQTDSVDDVIGESIRPPSLGESIDTMELGEIKEKFPRRYSMYVDILRNQRRGKESDSLPGMKKWIKALNALDEYVLSHQEGEHDGLRHHQIPVFEDLRDYLEKGGNGGYIKMPTGTGKTVIFSKFVQTLNLRTLVVVPKKTLVTQTQEEFAEFAPDLTTGVFYSNEKDLSGQVTIITYQSLVNQIKKGEIDPSNFDCVITDEAHKSQGKETLDALKKFTDSINIGFTATPGKLEHTSEEIHSITLREAVENFGALCSSRARFVRTSTNLDKVSLTQGGEYVESELEEAINIFSRNKAAVEIYKAYHGEESGVVFCSGIKHAEAVTRMFNEKGVVAETISGKDSKRVQDEKIRRFRNGEIKILCNADLLIEGFNAPNTSVCINLRPTRSLIVAEQRAGRILRLNKDDPNKFATVIDFIDETEDPKKMPITFAQVIKGAVIYNPNNSNREESVAGGESFGERKDFNVNIEGIEIIFDIEDVSSLSAKMMKLKEPEKINPYETYVDAKKAVRRIPEITNSLTYQAYRSLDPRLPSNPKEIYGFGHDHLQKDYDFWKDFLGKGSVKYKTYEEACNAVRRIPEITGWDSYCKYRHKDPMLPSNPKDFFSRRNITFSWDDFLGRKKQR